MSYKIEATLPQAGKVEIEYQWDRGDPEVGLNPGLEIMAVRQDGVDIQGEGKMTAADEEAVDEAASKHFTELMGEQEDDEPAEDDEGEEDE